MKERRKLTKLIAEVYGVSPVVVRELTLNELRELFVRTAEKRIR